jgi:hypothetical protein
MNKLTVTDQELFILREALWNITIRGKDAPLLAPLLEKIEKELKAAEARTKGGQG